MDKNKNSVFFAPGKPDHFVIGVDDDYIVSPASAEGNPLFEGLEAITTEEQAYYFLHNDGHSIYYWNGRKEALEEVLNLLEKGKTA